MKFRLAVVVIVVSLFDFSSISGENTPSQPKKIQEYEYSSFMKGLPVPLCKPAHAIRHPGSHAEVVDIVREAIQAGTRVKAFGTLHSATDIICTDGIPIDMTHLRGMRLNSDGSVTVGAGQTLRALSEFLEKYGKALNGLPGYGNMTVGGVMGSGSHGSSIKHASTIGEDVIELVVVDGRGDVRRVTNQDDLKAFRVHLGLLGVLLEVTVKTVPIYKIRAYNSNYPDEILTNGTLLQILKSTDHAVVYWFPAYHGVTVSALTRVDARIPGDAITNDHVPNVSLWHAIYYKRHMEAAQAQNSTEGVNLIQAGSALTLTRKFPGYPPIFSEDGRTFKNPAVGTYYKMVAPICSETGPNQCPWLHGDEGYRFMIQEISFDLRKLPAAVKSVRDILKKAPAAFPYQGILLRFSRATDPYMSATGGKPTCNFEFYVPLRSDPVNQPTLGLSAYQAILQVLVDKYGGKSHWGKTGAHFHSTQTLAKSINPERRKAFLAKMEEFDPAGAFMNSFGERLKGIGIAKDMDPNVKHCALLDACICKVSEDCAKIQACSRIEGYPNYPVCVPVTPRQKTLQVLDLRPIQRYLEPTLDFINRLLN